MTNISSLGPLPAHMKSTPESIKQSAERIENNRKNIEAARIRAFEKAGLEYTPLGYMKPGDGFSEGSKNLQALTGKYRNQPDLISKDILGELPQPTNTGNEQMLDRITKAVEPDGESKGIYSIFYQIPGNPDVLKYHLKKDPAKAETLLQKVQAEWPNLQPSSSNANAVDEMILDSLKAIRQLAEEAAGRSMSWVA